MQDTLAQLSDALVERMAAAQGFVIGIRGSQFRPRSGTLWRADVAVASEQIVPKTEEAEIVLADGRVAQARVAGRDRGTNVVAFRLQQPVEVELPAAVEPRLGAFALVFGADGGGGTIVRMGVVRALGPAWHSLGGGRIDHRISLDLTISSAEEGGPLDVNVLAPGYQPRQGHVLDHPASQWRHRHLPSLQDRPGPTDPAARRDTLNCSNQRCRADPRRSRQSNTGKFIDPRPRQPNFASKA